MNHLWPLITQSSPSFTALRLDAASGRSRRPRARSSRSTSATRPRRAGAGSAPSGRAFAQCSSVCMLPSSGAWALRTNGADAGAPGLGGDERHRDGAEAHAVPLGAAGAGSRGPRAFAFSRRPTIVRTYSPRSAAVRLETLLLRADVRVHELADLEAHFLDIGRESKINGHWMTPSVFCEHCSLHSVDVVTIRAWDLGGKK